MAAERRLSGHGCGHLCLSPARREHVPHPYRTDPALHDDRGDRPQYAARLVGPDVARPGRLLRHRRLRLGLADGQARLADRSGDACGHSARGLGRLPGRTHRAAHAWPLPGDGHAGVRLHDRDRRTALGRSHRRHDGRLWNSGARFRLIQDGQDLLPVGGRGRLPRCADRQRLRDELAHPPQAAGTEGERERRAHDRHQRAAFGVRRCLR